MSAPPENAAQGPAAPPAAGTGPDSGGPAFGASPAQRAVVADLQHSLRKHGIEAGATEIGAGLMEALAARPALCRGLLAAYLLDL